MNAFSRLVVVGICLASPVAAAERYFPTEDQGGVSQFEEKWYGGALRRMHEPSLLLSARDAHATVYRFTLLPTWGNPVTVRVAEIDGNYRVSTRRLDGMGGYEPGRLVEQRDADLPPAQSAELKRLLSRTRFFALPTQEETLGTDGDQWILEGVSGGKYHVVVRWCANEYNPRKRGLSDFVAVCSFLLRHAGQDPTNKGERVLK